MAKTKAAKAKAEELNENEMILEQDSNGNRYLPGAEEIVDKQIMAAAGEYHAIKTERIGMTAQELAAKEALADVCHEKKELFKQDPDNSDSKIYRAGNLVIRLKNEWKEKITTELVNGK